MVSNWAMSVSHGHPCESLPLGLLGDDDIIFFARGSAGQRVERLLHAH